MKARIRVDGELLEEIGVENGLHTMAPSLFDLWWQRGGWTELGDPAVQIRSEALQEKYQEGTQCMSVSLQMMWLY